MLADLGHQTCLTFDRLIPGHPLAVDETHHRRDRADDQFPIQSLALDLHRLDRLGHHQIDGDFLAQDFCQGLDTPCQARGGRTEISAGLGKRGCLVLKLWPSRPLPNPLRVTHARKTTHISPKRQATMAENTATVQPRRGFTCETFTTRTFVRIGFALNLYPLLPGPHACPTPAPFHNPRGTG